MGTVRVRQHYEAPPQPRAGARVVSGARAVPQGLAPERVFPPGVVRLWRTQRLGMEPAPTALAGGVSAVWSPRTRASASTRGRGGGSGRRWGACLVGINLLD